MENTNKGTASSPTREANLAKLFTAIGRLSDAVALLLAVEDELKTNNTFGLSFSESLFNLNNDLKKLFSVSWESYNNELDDLINNNINKYKE